VKECWLLCTNRAVSLMLLMLEWMEMDDEMWWLVVWGQAQSDDDEAGETVALNMAASGDKFMEEFFEQVRSSCRIIRFVFLTEKDCFNQSY